MSINWDDVRASRRTKERAPEWPEGVYGISLSGVDLLGLHEKTDKLYFDGREIVTKRQITLGTPERWIAVFAATGTFGTFIVNVGRATGLWP